MEKYITSTIHKLLAKTDKVKIKLFIDTDDNNFIGILNPETFMDGYDFIILNNPMSKQSGQFRIDESIISISSIKTLSYTIIDFNETENDNDK